MAILLEKLSIRLDRFSATNGEFMDQSLFGNRSTILNYLKVCGPSDVVEWNIHAVLHARHNHRFTTLNEVTNSRAKEVTPSIQSEAEDRILMETLLSSLHNELSEIQQHVIILRFLEGFSLRETAAITGRKVNNVKVIQNRGIAKLRKCLGFQVQNDRQELSS